jgi:hypothetical protein
MSIQGVIPSSEEILVDGSNSMLNNLSLNNNRIVNLANPTNNQDAASKVYCDTNSLIVESNCLLINGTNSMEASMDLNNHQIVNLANPTNTQDAATKNYIDNKFNGSNIFLGNASGSAVTTAVRNTSLGFESLKSVTTGVNNTAVGYQTLTNNNSPNNTAIGFCALKANITGQQNVAIGSNALLNNTLASRNIAVGSNTLLSNTLSNQNIAIGDAALFAYNKTPSANTNNIAIGNLSLTGLTTGTNNTAIGVSTMTSVTTGSNNTVIGHLAGSSFTGAESNNILIANPGVAGESNTIRIGTTNNSRLFLNGIYGVTSSGGVPVYINSSRQLGTVASSRRFKEKITDAKIYDISKLRVVNFNYIGHGGAMEVGLIAEEVEEFYPELVAYDENNLPYTVKYMDLIPILLQKIQSLEKLIYRWSSDQKE